MKIELEKALKQKYPKIFHELHNPEFNMQTSCMVWGIECPDCWYDLIDDLCAKITAIDPEGEVVAKQVKEKWGGLRFYIRGWNDEFYKLISEAEEKSYNVK